MVRESNQGILPVRSVDPANRLDLAKLLLSIGALVATSRRFAAAHYRAEKNVDTRLNDKGQTSGSPKRSRLRLAARCQTTPMRPSAYISSSVAPIQITPVTRNVMTVKPITR